MTDGARPGANLAAMAVDAEPSEYQVRVDAKICAERGCKNDPEPGSKLCASCRESANERARRGMEKLRADREARGLCRYHGNPVLPGSKACAACLVMRGQTETSGVNGLVNGRKDRSRGWDERAEGDGYQRRRYRGRMKRGRQSTDDLDNQDLRDAKKHLDHGIEGLAYFRSESVQALPRMQREEVKRAALAEIDRSRRWATDVLVRHRYIGPTDRNDDD